MAKTEQSRWAALASAAPVSERVLDALVWAPPEKAGGRWGVTAYFEGLPGSSKTDQIEDYASRWTGWASVTLAAGREGEGSFAAIPIPVERGGQTVLTYPCPEWVADVSDAPGGVVFLDEYTTSRGLAAQLAGITLGGRVGRAVLPPRVRVLCAANPSWLAMDARDLSLPERNRMVWLPWGPPSVEARREYQGALLDAPAPRDPLSYEAAILAKWPEVYARAMGAEQGFLDTFRHYKNTEPSEKELPFASDRSWSMATRLLASAEIQNCTEVETHAMITGCLGSTVASAWQEWRVQADLPRPAQLLTDAGMAAHDVDRYRQADRAIGVLGTCVEYVARIDAEASKAAMPHLVTLLRKYEARHADLVLLQAQSVARKGCGPQFFKASKEAGALNWLAALQVLAA